MRFYIVKIESELHSFKKAYPTRKEAEDYFDWYKNKFADNHIVHTDLDILVKRKITWWSESGSEENMSLFKCSFKKVNKKNICFLVNFNEQFVLNS